MIEPVGFIESGFEAVRDAFVENFESRGDHGASVCVYLDGQPVVDLAGGVDTKGAAYDDRTLQLVFSATKGATALCAHLLIQDGELDPDAPVVEYWPEFAEHNKSTIPISWLLCHKSGLIDTSMPLTLDEALDWDTITAALAASRPVWEPGNRHGYHALTYGWLVGEVVRRVSGSSIGEFFAKRVAGPLDLDFWIGLPEVERLRVSHLIPMSAPAGLVPGHLAERASSGGLLQLLDELLGPDNLVGRALTAPGGAFTDQSLWNSPQVWSATIPAANGITNARSLARMYAACIGEVDGIRLLDHSTLAAATEVQTSGNDAVLMMPIPFGLGFMRHSEYSGFSSPGAFGHYGAGGSVGFADPDLGIAFGYTMNKMQLSLAGDQRTGALIKAVKDSLRHR